MDLLELNCFTKDLNNNGIIRRLDELGRIVVPVEIRNNYLKSKVIYLKRIGNYIILSQKNADNSCIKREFDELGRIVINKEIRTDLELNPRDSVCIWVFKGCAIIKKYEEKCVFCRNEKKLIRFKDKLICEKCKKELSKV